jgi:hypothetical protein
MLAAILSESQQRSEEKEMRRIKSILARPALVIGLALALVGGSAMTFAAAASTAVIYACVNNSSGTIHVVSSADTCSTNEVALAWNQQGL